MCLLGSRRWIITSRGPKSSQTPHFGGLNRHFKPNMRKIQIAISSDLCIRLTWNLTGSCGQQQRLHGWSCMVVKQFQAGGRLPFVKWLYISPRKIIRFRWNFVHSSRFWMDELDVIKNEKVASDRRRIWQNVFLVRTAIVYFIYYHKIAKIAWHPVASAHFNHRMV